MADGKWNVIAPFRCANCTKVTLYWCRDSQIAGTGRAIADCENCKIEVNLIPLSDLEEAVWLTENDLVRLSRHTIS